MRNQRLYFTTLFLALTVLGFFCTDRAQAGSITYLVTVDTTLLDTQYGYLDFQFNPGGGSALPATATVTNFLTDGILNPSDLNNSTSGDVTNSLPGTPANPLTIDNGVNNNSGFNDYFEGFTYGTSIGFDLTLSGAAVNNSGTSPLALDGSSFAFSLYDSTGTIPQLTTDPNGSVLTINVNVNGTTSVETFPQSSSDNTPVASAPPLQSSVPAPPSIVLFILGIPAGLVYWRRSR